MVLLLSEGKGVRLSLECPRLRSFVDEVSLISVDLFLQVTGRIHKWVSSQVKRKVAIRFIDLGKNKLSLYQGATEQGIDSGRKSSFGNFSHVHEKAIRSHS